MVLGEGVLDFDVGGLHSFDRHILIGFEVDGFVDDGVSAVVNLLYDIVFAL